MVDFELTRQHEMTAKNISPFQVRGLYNVFNHAASVRVHMISLLRAGSPLVTLGLTIDEYAHKGSTIPSQEGEDANFRRKREDEPDSECRFKRSRRRQANIQGALNQSIPV
ncbi:hypothetical protein AVEN_231003-1 [Araneus ventricosus]|uniref:Uncharacterized protein n=1 Tax=Araneus ventricosus TaxID=182803 RepID=A0A4Y2A589_ARAVE|nr:hypothetical protein AVEN_231003-1 [Araneus ventricosus]